MAISQGDEKFCKWTHLENGSVLSRRLHRMEVQSRDGRLYIITGDALPNYLQTCAGTGHKGLHVAQILLDPKLPRRDWVPEEPAYWPRARDVVHWSLGVLSLLSIRFFIELVSASN